jgi:GrpB-like predicted nucleotidyltransferase (UPF0157 family)
MRALPPLPTAAVPATADELAKITVNGPPAQLRERVRILDYDPAWPAMFDVAATRIRAALGERVLALEHVGSTSVPGLAAKPLIDIDLIVADSSDEADYLATLEGIGFELRIREPHWYEHRMFRGFDPDVNLHVFGTDCDEHARHVIFRDWLRTHPDDRDLYASAKRAIATRDLTYLAEYTDAKSTVIVDILQRAGLRDSNP